MSSSFVVSTTLACVFGLVILFTASMFIYIFCFCNVAIRTKKSKQGDLESQPTTGASTKPIRSGRIVTGAFDAVGGDEIIVPVDYMSRDLSGDSTSADFLDASSHNINRPASIRTVSVAGIWLGETGDRSGSDHSVYSTLIVSPENASEVNNLDSFSKTLMIQHLIEDAINKEDQKDGDVIRKVVDPYSDNLISIGGVVVVIKPFIGVEGYEFSCLQPGDLLRVVKFYVREDAIAFEPRAIHLAKSHTREGDLADLVQRRPCAEESQEFPQTSDDVSSNHSFIGKDDINYNRIYCTGVLLNTCLEYDPQKNCLSLKFKNMSRFTKEESELLKDFPLSLVSLETTILTNTDTQRA